MNAPECQIWGNQTFSSIRAKPFPTYWWSVKTESLLLENPLFWRSFSFSSLGVLRHWERQRPFSPQPQHTHSLPNGFFFVSLSIEPCFWGPSFSRKRFCSFGCFELALLELDFSERFSWYSVLHLFNQSRFVSLSCRTPNHRPTRHDLLDQSNSTTQWCPSWDQRV